MVSPFDPSRLIRAAQEAPSVLNTQPWFFDIIADDRIELRATPIDQERRKRYLVISDRRKREMVISCGAALYNLCLAIRVTGHTPSVRLLPGREHDPDLLATIAIDIDHINPATRKEQVLYQAVPLRHTTREPFRSPPLAMNMAAELEMAGRIGPVNARLLYPRQIRELLRQTAKVNKKLKVDPSYLRELRLWTGDKRPHSADGLGVPAASFGPLPEDGDHTPIRDLGLACGERLHKPFEKDPRLIVLTTENNTPLEWMYVGQALQQLLLTATRYNVMASFLTQLFEYQDRYHEFTYNLWPYPGYCQIAIRVGRNPAKVPNTPHEPSLRVRDLRTGPPSGRGIPRNASL